MATTRLFYLVSYKTDATDYMGWMHCKRSVADFLGILEKGKTLAEAIAQAVVDVESFERSYTAADGTEKTTTVGAFKRALAFPAGFGGKRIVFQTGKEIGNKTPKSKKVVTMRANPGIPNLALIDALGELLPAGKVKFGDQPQATEVSAIFTIGASQYVIKPTSIAAGTPAGDGTADVADTVEEVKTIVAKQKGRKRTP